MASQQDHLAQAARNEATIKFLMQDKESHGGWIATVAFYTALHYIEAVFLSLAAGLHNHDHGARFKMLKSLAGKNSDFGLIYKRYRILFAASCIARYLEYNDGTSKKPVYKGFGAFRDSPYAKVEDQILSVCLKDVKNTVFGILERRQQKEQAQKK